MLFIFSKVFIMNDPTRHIPDSAPLGIEPPADWDARDGVDDGVLALVKAGARHGNRRSPEAIARTRAAVMAEVAAAPRHATVEALGTPPPPARVLALGVGEWLRLAAVCAAGVAIGGLWVAGTSTPMAPSNAASTTVAVADPAATIAAPAPEMMLVSGAPAAGPSTSGPAYEARQFLLLQQLQVGALIEDDASELARLQSLERNLIPDAAKSQSLTASERQAVAAYRDGERALSELQAGAASEHFAAARRAAPGTTMALLAQLRLAGLEMIVSGDPLAARASYATALAEYDRIVAAREWRPALAELAGQ